MPALYQSVLERSTKRIRRMPSHIAVHVLCECQQVFRCLLFISQVLEHSTKRTRHRTLLCSSFVSASRSFHACSLSGRYWNTAPSASAAYNRTLLCSSFVSASAGLSMPALCLVGTGTQHQAHPPHAIAHCCARPL